MRERTALARRPSEAGATPPPAARRLLVTGGLMIAAALQGADALIVNVALPQLERDLGGGIELGTWVMTSYLCATAVAAPFTALLRRRYGARRLFPAAVTAFIATSLLCAVAPSGAALLLFRVLQGASGGVILPLAQAMLLDAYPQERHGRAMGILGAVVMLGSILGPPLGGIITDLASWRATFLINLPLGLAAIAGVRLLRHHENTERGLAIDVVGMLLLVVTVGALQLCLERGVGRSWLQSPELLMESFACAIGLGALVLRSRQSGFSVFRLGVFRDVNFAVAGFYNFVISAMLFATLVLLPTMGEELFGFSATLAGLTIVPRAVLMMLVMLAVGEMIGRIDHRVLLCGGWLMMSAGLGLLSQIQPDTALAWIILGSTVQAAGAGLLFTPHSALAFATLAPELRTDATGLFSLLRQLGFASGVALMTAVLRLKLGAHQASLAGSNGDDSSAAALLAYSDCFRMMAVAALIVIPGIFLFRPIGAEQDRERAAPVG